MRLKKIIQIFWSCNYIRYTCAIHCYSQNRDANKKTICKSNYGKMRTDRFSDGLQFEVLTVPVKEFRQYKYRLHEIFKEKLTASEISFYRKRLKENGVNLSSLQSWANIPSDSPKSIPGDWLEKISDALNIAMRDLKYRE